MITGDRDSRGTCNPRQEKEMALTLPAFSAIPANGLDGMCS